MIELKHIEFAYEYGSELLRDINMQVNDGEYIAIVGENGSGKTNILEAISFLTPGRGLRSARLADIKRFTPAVISEDYMPGNGGWAVSAVRLDRLPMY